MMNRVKNEEHFGNTEDVELINLFHETIQKNEKLDSIIDQCKIQKIKKQLDEYEKEIERLKIENFHLKDKINEINSRKCESENKKISGSSTSTQDFPSSFSSISQEKDLVIQQYCEEETNLLKEEQDYKFLDLSFEIIPNEEQMNENIQEQKINEIQKESFESINDEKIEKESGLNSEETLLRYSPLKNFYDLKIHREIGLSDEKAESLKIVILAFFQNINISKWSQTVLICWFKNFLFIPIEIIPLFVEIVQTIDFENFSLKKEIKKRKKMNEIYVLKTLLAVEEVIDFQKKFFTEFEKISYFNRTMHHQWMANYFLTHIGLTQYFSIFQKNLIDARILQSMDKSNMKHYLEVDSSYQRKCLLVSSQYLKFVNFDRRKFEKLIQKEQEVVDEVRFWPNVRFIKWLNSFVDVNLILGLLETSGLCGMSICHYPEESTKCLKNILKKFYSIDTTMNVLLALPKLFEDKLDSKKSQDSFKSEKISSKIFKSASTFKKNN